MPDNVNITVNETIENVVINPSISIDVIDFNITSTTENVTIDVTPNLTTVNINSISGSPVTKTSDLINDGEDGIHPFITIEDVPAGGLTSVGLTMPVAFSVANSPLTSDGTIAVTAAGTSSQYIRGDGQLATLPSGGGGGASVFYYLNGSIAASVATYKQLSNTAVIGVGTDFSLTGNGLITQFLTDVGNPNRLQIPSGAWNFEMFFSMSSSGGTPKFYVELLKYDGITFTTIANNSAAPETISGGTSIDLYLSSLAVPETTLLLTDRLAIRVYIVNSTGGRTATLHTEDNHLCQITTTFASGISAINGLTTNNQYLAVGTTGTNFNISSVSETHTFNLPTASATNRGALSTTDWTAFNGKFTLPALTSGSVLFSNGTTIAQDNSNFFFDDTNNRLGIGTNTPTVGLETKGGFNLYTSLGNHYLTSTSASATDSTLRFTRGNENGWCRFQLGGGLTIGADNNSGEIKYFVSSGGFFTTFYSNGVERMRMTTTGNTLINTTTDQGGKLQIKAPGALSTDIALRVRNSADTGDLMTVNGLGSTKTLLNFITPYNSTSGNYQGLTTDFSGTNGFICPFGESPYGSGRTRIINTYSTGAIEFYTSKGVDYAVSFTAMFNAYGNLLIGTPTDIASSKLTIESTTQGFLPPRMTTIQKNAIATPASGLVVYDTTLLSLYQYNGTSWTNVVDDLQISLISQVYS